MEKENREDELDIDLKKVWPFKRKEKKEGHAEHEKAEPAAERKQPAAEKHHEPEQQPESEDEINIDFSGIFGKKSKAEHKPEHKPDHKREAEHKEHKPEHKEHETKHHAKTDDEEIDLGDIGSKFKSLFKGQPKDKSQLGKSKADEEEVSVDIKGISTFLDSKKGMLLPILAIIIIVAVGTYVRMIPSTMAFTEDWAKSSVYGTIRSDIETVIVSQYPNLPDQQKAKLIDEEFGRAMKNDIYTFKAGQYAGQQMSVKQQTKQTQDYFNSFFQDGTGRMYMQDIDPYYWWRYAINIVDHGYPGDTIKDGRSYDTFQLAPNGRFVEPEDTFHPYSMAYLFYILRIFNPGMALIDAVMLTPVVVMAMVSILVFLIARQIGGNVAGFFAGLMMAISPSTLTRSLWGHADSDIWVLFCSVLSAFLFLWALEAKHRKWQLILAGLAGVSIGLYSRFWGGWWSIFDYLVAVIIIYMGYFALTNHSQIMKGKFSFIKSEEMKSSALILAVFLLLSGISVSLLSSWETFYSVPLSSVGFTRLKTPVMESLWPNVLTTVAELNEGDVNSVVSQMGGPFLFLIALMGIAATIIKRKLDAEELIFIAASFFYWMVLIFIRGSFLPVWFVVLLSLPIVLKVLYAAFKGEQIDMKLATLLIIWFMVTIYATTKGIRFALLMAPAFSIAFGAFVGFLFRHVNNFFSRELHINRLLTSVILISLGLVLFVFPANVWGTAVSVGKQDSPMINDAWFNSLAAIRDNSSKNAIITSWWDFGHHFKALAERPVTFDGTTQGSPQAHWVGQILRTDNEEMAVGILRMLDCGGNDAFNKLYEMNNDTLLSVNILYDIFELDRAEAKKTLAKTYKLTDPESEEVLKYSHCSPPEAYFIASEDMIGKSGVWGHFGSWNFERAYIWERLKAKPEQEAVAEMMKKFNYTEDNAQQTYYDIQAFNDAQGNSWVSPWPSYALQNSQQFEWGCELGKDKSAVCYTPIFGTNQGPIPIRVNFTSREVRFDVEGPKRYFRTATFATEKGVETTTRNADDIAVSDLAAIITPEGENYKISFSAPELNASMFTKMFMMQGHSLKHFKLLTYQRSITGAQIYVYKVDWKGGEANIKKEFVKKEKIAPGDTVSFNYIGYLENGEVFDSSIHNWRSANITKDESFTANSSPFTFKMGEGQVISGVEEQMLGMKTGDEKTIKVPPEKGYGTDPSQHPLGNKTIYFKVSIEKIK